MRSDRTIGRDSQSRDFARWHTFGVSCFLYEYEQVFPVYPIAPIRLCCGLSSGQSSLIFEAERGMHAITERARQTSAMTAGFTWALALCCLAGCSRDASDGAAEAEQSARRPAAAIPAAGPAVAEDVKPPVTARGPAWAADDNAPEAEAGESVDPVPLESAEAAPGQDALLEALDDHGGDLKQALKAVSSRIEYSSRDEIILLNLSGSHVTDAALEKISTLDNLLVLDIWDAPITDAGLAQIGGMTQLRALGLRGTKVTDAGLKHLEEMTSLKELNLELTGVTDAGLKRLGHLRSLHKLSLDDTAVTGDGINNLQVALPLCEIAW
jgi:hypothetical protein